MSVVYLHGLGQTPASWESVLRVLGQESGGLCPDLFGLIRGKEVCYEKNCIAGSQNTRAWSWWSF